MSRGDRSRGTRKHSPRYTLLVTFMRVGSLLVMIRPALGPLAVFFLSVSCWLVLTEHAGTLNQYKYGRTYHETIGTTQALHAFTFCAHVRKIFL